MQGHLIDLSEAYKAIRKELFEHCGQSNYWGQQDYIRGMKYLKEIKKIINYKY